MFDDWVDLKVGEFFATSLESNTVFKKTGNKSWIHLMGDASYRASKTKPVPKKVHRVYVTVKASFYKRGSK